MDVSKDRAKYECHIRGLETMNTKIQEAGFELAALLIRKLSTKIRDNNINRSAGSSEWTLNSVRAAINKEIEPLKSIEPEDREKFISTDTEYSKPPHRDKHKSNSISKTPSSTARTFNVSSKVSIIFNCTFCFKGHSSAECMEYSTANELIERAKELHLCFNWLSNSHSADNCRSIGTCNTCNRKHHSSMCYRNSTNTTPVNTVNNSENIIGIRS